MNKSAICILFTGLLGYSVHSLADESKPPCLPIMDPVKDNCEVMKDEPKPTPAWKLVPKDDLCLSYQKVAEELTKARDQGAREDDVARMLQDRDRRDMIWIARQVYWSQSAGMKPEKVGFNVWMRCDKDDYPKY